MSSLQVTGVLARHKCYLMAQAVVDQHQELAKAHSSWVYATDQDKFLDFHAHQSVNANPSIHLESQP